MKNPIPRCNFFATPVDADALMEYIGSMTGPERAVAMTAAMMALNLAHQLVEELHVGEEV